MGFQVEIEPQAFEDIDSITGYINAASDFEVAQKWFNGILEAIASLSDLPTRCAVMAPESEELGQEIRLLLYGRKNRTYKIYFSSDQDSDPGLVRVFHVRHWARKPVTLDELGDLTEDEPDIHDED